MPLFGRSRRRPAVHVAWLGMVIWGSEWEVVWQLLFVFVEEGESGLRRCTDFRAVRGLFENRFFRTVITFLGK